MILATPQSMASQWMVEERKKKTECPAFYVAFYVRRVSPAVRPLWSQVSVVFWLYRLITWSHDDGRRAKLHSRSCSSPSHSNPCTRHTSVSHEEARDSIKLLDITRVLFWLKDFNIILRRKDSTFKCLWHLKMYFYSFPPLIQHAVQLSSIIKPKIL